MVGPQAATEYLRLENVALRGRVRFATMRPADACEWCLRQRLWFELGVRQLLLAALVLSAGAVSNLGYGFDYRAYQLRHSRKIYGACSGEADYLNNQIHKQPTSLLLGGRCRFAGLTPPACPDGITTFICNICSISRSLRAYLVTCRQRFEDGISSARTSRGLLFEGTKNAEGNPPALGQSSVKERYLIHSMRGVLFQAVFMRCGYMRARLVSWLDMAELLLERCCYE